MMVEKQDAPKAGEDDRVEGAAASAVEASMTAAADALRNDVFGAKGGGYITDCFPSHGGKLHEELNKLPAEINNIGANIKDAASSIKDAVDPKNDLRNVLRDVNDKKIVLEDMLMRDRPTFKSEGAHDFKTGDRLVVKDGKETLVTPSGDIFTVDQAGKVKVEGEVKGVEVSPKGGQVYTMADGAKITVDRSGISSIERNGRTINLISDRLFKEPIGFPPIKYPDWQMRNKLEK